MSRSDYRSLLDRGRRAGLTTSELYAALATRPRETGEPGFGQTDGNGYVPDVDADGHRVYRPGGPVPRP